MPAAMSSGPTVSGRRGPICWASAPARDENTSMIAVTGNIAEPAASADHPPTTWRLTVRRKNTTPIPP